jgi:DNA-binding NarL/FixJ family response regulator
MVADGMTNRAIAATLGIGVTTVEKHISHILRQWNVSSRAGITAVALSSPEDSDDRPPARTA